MPDMMLPTTRHVKELIEHAEEHLTSGTDWDLKVSMIHADNSIEIMLKEYLRYSKEKSWGQIEHKTFYEILNSCSDINLVNTAKSFFLAYHDMRNAVYHIGTLVPMKEDVKSVLGFAKTLFNELHPKLRFAEAHIKSPSLKTVQTISEIIGFQPHMTEMMLLSRLSNYFTERGFEILVEPKLPYTDVRADLIAQTRDKLILCEIKIRGPGMVVGREAIHQVRTYADRLRKKNTEKNIEIWLVTNTRFSKGIGEIAEKHNIQLIDARRLKKLLD